jgi:hypothetical protein
MPIIIRKEHVRTYLTDAAAAIRLIGNASPILMKEAV